MSRLRLHYFIAALTTLSVGLLSRSIGLSKDHFVVSYLGDVLWAALVYFLLRSARPKLPIQSSALCAGLFCLLIELQQLCQAEWLVHIRSNSLFALVLGHSYSSADLLCYSCGIGIALVCDSLRKKDVAARFE